MENFVLFDMDDDVKVACRPTLLPRIAMADRAETPRIDHAGGDLQFDPTVPFDTSFSRTLPAGI